VLPPTINNRPLSEYVGDIGREVLGSDRVRILEHPAMVSEDFSLYSQRVPGCLFLLGTGNGSGSGPGLHSARFLIDERILPMGSAILAQTALDFSGIATDSGA
jgi:metal-dependent amidase/aminoacylase/carboxypeptidase family protein